MRFNSPPGFAPGGPRGAAGKEPSRNEQKSHLRARCPSTASALFINKVGRRTWLSEILTVGRRPASHPNTKLLLHVCD